MTTVALTQAEYDASAAMGLKREALRKLRGKSPAEYADNGGSHDARNALGAVAEYALAKFFGPAFVRDWVENRAYSENHATIDADVMGNVHVRATRYANGGLVLHPYDVDDGAFVLAVVDELFVAFPGWVRARAGKLPKFWRDTGPGFGKRPAYVVPQKELLGLGLLRPTGVGDEAGEPPA